MTKDNSEVLLDGLVHATEWAEEHNLDELGEFLGALYQVAGQVVFGNGDNPATEHPCAVDVMASIKKREG